MSPLEEGLLWNFWKAKNCLEWLSFRISRRYIMPRAKHWSQRTKIVCTLGPAAGKPGIIERLIGAGLDVARLNLSHGTLKEHAAYISTVRNLSERTGVNTALLLDLPGPKYRTGEMKDGSAVLKKGSRIVLTSRRVPGDDKVVPVNFPTLARDVKAGSTILVDDGAMQLRVEAVRGQDVICKVIAGGVLTPGRGIVVPGVRVSEPFLTQGLKSNLEFAIQQKPDFIALSFVTGPEDVEQVRKILRKNNAVIPIISKIEREEAVRHFDDILAVSDGIMVARGDLGVEIPLKKVPLVQKEIIRKCNIAGKYVITATQMLESMVNSPRPTRAEVTDVANAILDGTDAIMLSAETSVGKYPLQAVKMMSEIAREADRHLPYEKLLIERGEWLEHQTDELISYNACYTAYWIKAAAIVAFTQSGSTARRVAKYRPRVPIIAITNSEEIPGQLMLCWGVHAFYIPNPVTVEELFRIGSNLVKDLGIARPGDLIVITGGIPLGITGTTNLLKVQEIT
jgi:pyruvate kinase